LSNAALRQRILLIGCGDIALRTVRQLRGRYRLYGLARHAEQSSELRRHGVVPINGDLDARATLARLNVSPYAVLHFAPPHADERTATDTRTAHLLARLSRGGSLPQRLVYISTTGVYGDCDGAQITETRPANPRTPRARRRVDAERLLRAWGARNGVTVNILRAPGIYAANRLPVDRIRSLTPVLRAHDDPYTNHIHADDLARAVIAALSRGRPNRVHNIVDEAELKMGQWFDLIADAFDLSHPPRISLERAERELSPQLLSFMRESRRIINLRMKHELRVRLQYATPQIMLDELRRARDPQGELPL
jgi:nucleoside-diphosphate-sugar epimerase